MGLIKAGLGALGGVLADQWKEFFYCDALDNEVLMVKGQKQVGSRSSNTKGSDNVISNGSGIVVADGQAMMIVEQGKVVEFCAEPGEFTYDTSLEPSIFAGNLGESIKQTFVEIGKRFTYGGDTGKDQRVYYFNLKEISGNRYGTQTPIPFRVVVNEALGFKLSVDIRCNGEFSYTITNPMLLYTKIAGNVSDRFMRADMEDILRAELLDALQPALATVAAQGVEYYEIPGHSREVKDALEQELNEDWSEKRGITIYSFNINSLSIPDEQKKKITEWEETAMTSNPNVAGARIVGAQADAMRTAADNDAGAMTGFMGMGMAMNAGSNAQGFYAMGQQPQYQQQYQQPTAPANAEGWKCECGSVNSGNFCGNCGAKKPEANTWTCACGSVNTGKFCGNCGARKPESGKCPTCGKDVGAGAKFCPDCGTRLG